MVRCDSFVDFTTTLIARTYILLAVAARRTMEMCAGAVDGHRHSTQYENVNKNRKAYGTRQLSLAGARTQNDNNICMRSIQFESIVISRFFCVRAIVHKCRVHYGSIKRVEYAFASIDSVHSKCRSVQLQCSNPQRIMSTFSFELWPLFCSPALVSKAGEKNAQFMLRNSRRLLVNSISIYLSVRLAMPDAHN